MQVSSEALDDEVRLTVEAAIDITNAINDGADAARVREILIDHRFGGASTASPVEIEEAFRSLTWLAGLIDALPAADLTEAVASTNRALAGRAVSPSVTAHDGSVLHIHWTSPDVPLGGSVVVDILMAIAQTLCDNGVDRFGRCAADGCTDVFYDATKNNTRRFCADPRCASRTHTANHRARQRT